MESRLHLAVDGEGHGARETTVAEHLRRVQRTHPSVVEVVGRGRGVGKASWIAVVLQTEFGYSNSSMKLERVMDGPADLAQITILLEAVDRGAVAERS